LRNELSLQQMSRVSEISCMQMTDRSNKPQPTSHSVYVRVPETICGTTAVQVCGTAAAMELSSATRAELLRRLAGGAQDTTSTTAGSHSAVAELDLLVLHADESSDLQSAQRGWQDRISTLGASRVVRQL
jgi:hypothetical protein